MKQHMNCFISYCWSNSHSAIKKGSREVPGGLGATDPRVIKDEMESRGYTCWLDVEQAGRV